MSSGYAGCSAWIISLNSLSKYCPKETEDFKTALKTLDDDIETALNRFAFIVNECNDPDEEEKDTDVSVPDEAWKRLELAFTKATAVDDSKLDLELCYHDSSMNGDKYDEVDGAYICVNGFMTRSKAGAKVADDIEHAAFVQYG